ncbi:isoleucine--tRNA ligase [Bdellovibrionota bacterium]
MNYKDSLNLPKTDFPMKANLTKREPELIDYWDKEEIYHKVIDARRGNPKFIFHDGPPYANGDIHLGTSLNKILKDFVVKSKNMGGYCCEYIPGWDCHGLPIEHRVVDKQFKGKDKHPSVTEIRELCYDYAMKYVDIQRDQFKRLGVLGLWEKPYLTVDHQYEATVLRKLADFAGKDLLYKGKRPIQWCMHCVTALAEAEVEYEDHKSPSIFIKFPLPESVSEKIPELKGKNSSVLVWTTTPWTIPANLAISLNPNFEYVAVEVLDEVFIVAKGLLDTLTTTFSWKNPKIIASFEAGILEKVNAKHPFIDRDSTIILGGHVTLEQGTGCVHTAPGHGLDDYLIGLAYGLDVYTPVDEHGCFTKDVEHFAGQNVWDANKPVIDLLEKSGKLEFQQNISHSYPHCWRCKNPVIFRSTEQWFISVDKDDLRKRSLKAIDEVQWIPSWGRNRIYGMLENRPDWCISRQRSWGVPIVSFRCSSCNEPHASKEIINHVADLVEKDGTNIWFTRDAKDLLPSGMKCSKCGKSEFKKENDILDVWFESGVSWAAVLDNHPDLHSPSDLYLEGSDQHRGWFQSSLLAGMGTTGRAPYKAVLTHGFTVDEKGRKMSKSLGNYVDSNKFVGQNGADLLRLWVSSVDYRNDVGASENLLKRVGESYRRIRNTCRFILGNLYDFDPAKDLVPYEDLEEIDKVILHRLTDLNQRIRKAYETYEFHSIYHATHNFCTVDLSAFYLDIIKDRLYCSGPTDKTRRTAQSTSWHILHILTKLLAPILSFSMEEVWRFLPKEDQEESVHLTEFPTLDPKWVNGDLDEKWKKIELIKSEIAKALEVARKEKKIIGHPLEAAVVFELPKSYEDLPNVWKEVLIVSEIELASPPEDILRFESEEIPGFVVGIRKASGEKCERCWMRTPEVGQQSHKDICKRCGDVVTRLTK